MSAPLDRELASEVLERLRVLRERGEAIPESFLAECCRMLGRNRATVLRWVRRGSLPQPRRARFRLADAHKVAIFEAGGSPTDAYEGLVAAGTPGLGSLRSFQRATPRDLTEQERAYAAGGPRESRAIRLFLERREEGRGICLEADHKQADVLVVPPRGKEPVRPWITLFADTFSRGVAGLAASLRPTEAEVLAALGAALRRNDELGPFHGVPELLRIDRGLEFTANAITEAGVMLGFQVVHTPPYTPHRKGKVERLHRTVVAEFFSQLPYFTGGPRRRDGTLDLPEGVEPLPFKVFVAEVFDFCARYNLERPHNALGGRTPATAWEEDDRPIREASEAALRRFLLKDLGSRIVQTRGVMVNRRWYTAAELEPLIGREVEPRAIPHDHRQVEIFHRGEWVATAYAQDEASPEERERVLRANELAARRAARLAREAKRRKKRRWASMVARGEPVETTSVSKAEVEALEDMEAKGTLRGLGLGERRGQRRKQSGGGKG